MEESKKRGSSRKAKFFEYLKRDHERRKEKSSLYKIKRLETSVDDWWTYHLKGIIGITVGVILLAWPEETLYFLVIVMGIQALVKGAIGLVHAAYMAKRGEKWGLVLLEGAAGVLFGVLLFAWPETTLRTATVLIGLWMLLTGLGKMLIAFENPSMVSRILIGLGGLLSIIIGTVLAVLPIESIQLAHALSGIQALVLGIIFMYLGFHMMGFTNLD